MLFGLWRIVCDGSIRHVLNPAVGREPDARLSQYEIAALPPSIQGTISSYRCPRKKGPPAVYHNFQYTLKGKNHSMTIPVDMVSEFKDAIASGKKLKDLVLELSSTDARLLVEQAPTLKKSSHISS